MHRAYAQVVRPIIILAFVFFRMSLTNVDLLVVITYWLAIARSLRSKSFKNAWSLTEPRAYRPSALAEHTRRQRRSLLTLLCELELAVHTRRQRRSLLTLRRELAVVISCRLVPPSEWNSTYEYVWHINMCWIHSVSTQVYTCAYGYIYIYVYI